MISSEVADKISRYLRLDDIGGREFWAAVAERRNRSLGSLKVSSELIQIGKMQGELAVIDWLLKLKENA